MRKPLLAFLGVIVLVTLLLALPAWTQPPAATPPATTTLPAVFDLRDLDLATPIKAQLGGTCWTHGTMAAIESHLLLTGFWKALDRENGCALSEYHLDWWNGFNKHFNDDVADPAKDASGLRIHNGGDYRVAAAYLSRGEGVVVLPRDHDRFRDADWYQKAPPRFDDGYQRLYVRDVDWFTLGDNLEGIETIKRKIMTDGALGTCYAAGRTYDSKDFVHYQPPDAKGDPNHAVAIIGWDDTKVSTDPDKPKPPKPGCWLIKNSWGTRRVEGGYNWISYYDKHCCRHPEMGAVSFRNIEPMSYTNVYYHDLHGWRDTLADVSKAFNAYTSTGRQLIRAVSFYTTKPNVGYTVRICNSFEKGNLQGEMSVKTGVMPFTGFHTVNLDAPVLMQKDSKFYVAVELADGGHAIDRTSQVLVLLDQQPQPQPQQPQQPGQGQGQPPPRQFTPPWVISKANPGESFYHDGTGWKDLYEKTFKEEKFNKTANFCIKALAVSVEESPYAKLPSLLKSVTARNIGPANMGGRIVDVEAVESNPNTIYVGAATGGVWKTTDGGTTWAPIFDRQTTLCIGDIAVSPSNPDIVWVGTGEANPRNSVTYGDGIFKSTDGGKTWTNMGLALTRHIGRVVIHPKNPDIVYVAALGNIWAAPAPAAGGGGGSGRFGGGDRGLYRTSDGGKTWVRVKSLDANTGFIDVAMDPNEPDTLYAAAYQARRDGFSGGNPATQFGPNAGLYKTTDGGKTWEKLKDGLPEAQYGRCGLAVYRKDPHIVYAVIQTDKAPAGTATPKAGEDPATGGIFRSEDKGKTWKKVNDLCPRPFYYGQIRIDPNDDQRVYVLGVSFYVSSDGGKTFSTSRGTHPDHHGLWINPNDSTHLILGNDGGLYFSKDQAKTWEAVRGMALGQFYAVAVDMRKPYRVYGGLQDNGSWGGPSATTSTEGIVLSDWRSVGGGDGFYCQVDPTDPDVVYSEMQYGGLRRVNLKNRADSKGSLRPRPPMDQPAYRFNWNTPMLLSSHDPKVLYYGGNHLFRSPTRGDTWDVISPDLTRGQPGPSPDSGHTITTIAESPLKAGVLYVGTDDGKLHVSRDGGKTWTDLSEKVPGLPPERWVSRVECSNFAEGTAYLAIDRHRNADLRPYLYKTTDYGATWTRLMNNLPEEGPVHVIRESSKNKDLLFVGTETGLFVSVEGGRRWNPLTDGMPKAVPVHDLVIHPRDRELVIGTHGRSVYVMDIAPLEELTPKVLTSDVYLFEVKSATAFKLRDPEKPAAERTYKASNPAYGAAISYYLRSTPTQPIVITVSDKAGAAVASFEGAKAGGLHHVVWDLRPTGDKEKRVEPGEYTVTLKIGDKALTRVVRVEPGDAAATEGTRK